MTFVVILIIFILTWWLFGDKITAWFRQLLINRMEDTMRRAMGMPSRREQQRAEKRARKNAGYGNSHSRNHDNSQYHRQYAQYARYTGRQSILPKEYAEDVEFVEFKDYSSESVDSGRKGEVRYNVEEQVSDVEFTEIRTRS